MNELNALDRPVEQGKSPCRESYRWTRDFRIVRQDCAGRSR